MLLVNSAEMIPYTLGWIHLFSNFPVTMDAFITNTFLPLVAAYLS